MVGGTFGNLTVMRLEQDLDKDARGTYFAICKCEVCGREDFKTRPSSIKKGCTNSCGCSRNYDNRTGDKHKNFTGHKEIRGKKWGNIQKSAKARKIPFDLKIEDAWEVFETQDRKCALTKLPICFGKNKEQSTASLDRIDSSKGYIKSNIQWTHKDINRIKSDLDQSYFIRLCRLVVDALDAKSPDNIPCAS